MRGSVGTEIKENARKRKTATLHLNSSEITLVRELLLAERDKGAKFLGSRTIKTRYTAKGHQCQRILDKLPLMT